MSRTDAAVEAITFAVFDLDAPPPEALGQLAQALQGVSYVVHSTHTAGSFRLILELDHEVPGELWPQVWASLIEKYKIPADMVCGNLSRIYFFPAIHEPREFEFYEGEGLPFDWETTIGTVPGDVSEIRKRIQDSLRPSPQDTTDPRHYAEGPIDLGSFREALGKIRKPESRELLNLILSGKRLAESGSRDSTINRAASLLASVPPAPGKPYPPAIAMALLEPGIRAMPVEPEGAQFWLDKAKYSYTRAITRRLAFDQAEADNQDVLNKLLGRDPKAPTPAADEWRRKLLYAVGENGEASGIRNIGSNAMLILENDPLWKGKIRFNVVTKEIDVAESIFKAISPATLDVEVMNWFAASDYRLLLRSHEIREQLLAVARKNEYDPLKDYLLTLHWDGHDRATNFLRNYYNAVGEPEHLQRIGRAWLVSAVARALDPGCRVDTVLMFQGGQGVGKTTSLEILGGDFFTNTKMELNDRDSRMLTSRSWIVELAELATMRRYDDEARKAFFSQAEDRLRPPYGRVIEVFKRRCVFVGTTNADEYLTDPTGARRYWPVEVRVVELDNLRRDRDQIWAQAVALYQAREPWWLDKEEAGRAEEVAKQFMRGSIRAEQVMRYFSSKPVEERPKFLTTLDVAHDVFQIPAPQIDDRHKVEIGYAMSELGFNKRRKRVGGVLVWVFETPRKILEMVKGAIPREDDPSGRPSSESLPN